MVSALISRVIILVFGTLYPAYSSYKAVKTKNVKEYVKWMMYWIVFALFTTAETFADVLISWFPFYYEMKIIFVVWLLSPATKGSSVLYRKFVHPGLMKREEDIDQALDRVKTQGYSALLNVGTQGINLAVQGALTGQSKIVDQIRRSYSLSDIAQGGGSKPAYQPQNELIAEDADEPDFEVPPPPADGALLTQNEKTDAEKPIIKKQRSLSGYNLRRPNDSHSEAETVTRRPAHRHSSYNHSESDAHTESTPNKKQSHKEPHPPIERAPANNRTVKTSSKRRSRSAGRKPASRKQKKEVTVDN